MWKTVKRNAFLVLISMFIGLLAGIAGALIAVYGWQEWVRLLYQWQTIAAGSLAILAAAIGAFAARVSMREQFIFSNIKQIVESADYLNTFAKECENMTFVPTDVPVRVLDNHDDVVTHASNLNKHGFPSASDAAHNLIKVRDFLCSSREQCQPLDDNTSKKIREYCKEFRTSMDDMLHMKGLPDMPEKLSENSPLGDDQLVAALTYRMNKAVNEAELVWRKPT